MSDLNLIDLLKLVEKHLNSKPKPKAQTQLEKIQAELKSIIQPDQKYDEKFKKIIESECLEERLALREQIDERRLNDAKVRLDALIFDMTGDELDKIKKELIKARDKLAKKIKSLKNIYKADARVAGCMPYALAKIFGAEVIPFCQSFDPIMADGRGYCFGHTNNWGLIVANADSADPYPYLDLAITNRVDHAQKNQETPLSRRDYIPIEPSLSSLIWHHINNLKQGHIAGFVFCIHSVAFRLYGDGIEFFDSNYGIFRFKTKYDFVRFINLLVIHYSRGEQLEGSMVCFEFSQRPVKIPNAKPRSTALDEKTYAGLLADCKKTTKSHVKDSALIEKIFTSLSPAPMAESKTGLLGKLIVKITQIATDLSKEGKDLEASNIQYGLRVYSEYVRKHSEIISDQDKACLLFALMIPALSGNDWSSKEPKLYDSPLNYFLRWSKTYNDVLTWAIDELFDIDKVAFYYDKLKAHETVCLQKLHENKQVNEQAEKQLQQLREQLAVVTTPTATQAKEESKECAVAALQRAEATLRCSAYRTSFWRSKANQNRYIALQNMQAFNDDMSVLNGIEASIANREWVLYQSTYRTTGKEKTLNNKKTRVPYHVSSILDLIEQARQFKLTPQQALRKIYVIAKNEHDEGLKGSASKKRAKSTQDFYDEQYQSLDKRFGKNAIPSRDIEARLAA